MREGEDGLAMYLGFARCPRISSLTAATFFCLVAMAALSCGGGVSMVAADGSSTEGGSREGSSPSGSTGSLGSPTAGSGSGSASVSEGGPALDDGSFSGMPAVDGGPPSAGSATSPPGSLPPGQIFSPSAGIGPGCMPSNGTGGGTYGHNECTISYAETCGGSEYQATCACPQSTCACFGSSTQVISFTGCPSCPAPAQVYELCGFPFDKNRM